MVPRIFHRIWFGTRPRPERYEDYWRKWQELHPGSVFHTWDESQIADIGLVNQDAYNRIGQVARSCGVHMSHERAVSVQRADVVAYELVNRFGGIYLNCDMMPLRPIDDLLEQRAFIGMEDHYFACNAVMGGEPGHSLYESAVTKLGARFNRYWRDGMEVATGPHHLTDVWRSGNHDVAVLPTRAFYPVHHSQIPYGTDSFDQFVELGKAKGAYAVHMWGHRSQEGRLHN